MAFLRTWRSLCACALLLGAAACSSSSSKGPSSKDEQEPLDKSAPGAVTNDTAQTAEAITVGTPLFGALADATDVDYFRFHAPAGKLLTVDSYAVRLDPEVWSDSPRLKLLAADGTTVLYTNGPDETLWNEEDAGFALVPIPADGDYYIAIDASDASMTVGKYALRLALTSPPGALQHEQEAPEETGLNNTRDTAEPISPGLLSGYYENGDPDVYEFTLTAETRVRFTMTADRNGTAGAATATFDTMLDLIDGEGTLLANNDDTWYLDSSVERVLAPGDYWVSVSKCCGVPSEPYLLSYEVLPLSPVDEILPNNTQDSAMAIEYGTSVRGTFIGGEANYFKWTGKAGELVRVHSLEANMTSYAILDGDGASIPYGWSDGGPTYAQTMLQADGTYYLIPFGTSATFAFRLERIAAGTYESEPDEDPAHAGAFSSSGWAAGAITAADDLDAYGFSAGEGQLVTVALHADESYSGAAPDSDWGSSLIRPQLQIYDAAGTLLVQTRYRNLNETSPTSLVRPSSTIEAAFRAPSTGQYFAVVSIYDADAGPNAFYALRLRKNE